MPQDAAFIYPLGEKSGLDAIEIGIAVDNDVQVWFNGADVSGGFRVSEGCATGERYSFSVPAGLLQDGENLIAMRARDRGLHSYVDVRVTITGPIVPTVSEWGMMAMAGLLVLAGAVVVSKRRGAAA